MCSSGLARLHLRGLQEIPAEMSDGEIVRRVLNWKGDWKVTKRKAVTEAGSWGVSESPGRVKGRREEGSF